LHKATREAAAVIILQPYPTDSKRYHLREPPACICKDSLTDVLRVFSVWWSKMVAYTLGTCFSGCLIQLVSNIKVKLS